MNEESVQKELSGVKEYVMSVNAQNRSQLKSSKSSKIPLADGLSQSSKALELFNQHLEPALDSLNVQFLQVSLDNIRIQNQNKVLMEFIKQQKQQFDDKSSQHALSELTKGDQGLLLQN